MRINKFALCVGISAFSAFADETHYKNILIGERAVGMGGAFNAISDDPSGIYYNPAGLAFSFENYISLSANALASSRYDFENVVGGQGYTLESSSFAPVFFGFTQFIGRYKFAFAIIVPNSILLDQEDELKDFSTVDGEANYLTRRFFSQDTTYLVGPALARELSKNFSIGATVFGRIRVGKTIDNQVVAYNPVPDGDYLWVNTYTRLSVYSLDPKIGIQWMPAKKWSLGLTVGRPFRISGNAERRSVRSTTNTDGEVIDYTGVFSNDITLSESGQNVSAAEPIKVSLGAAYFANKRLLVSADFDFFGPDAIANVASTYNWSVGTEYFVTPTLPFRLGVYSNNSNTNVVAGDYYAVDLIGFAGSFSLNTQGSSFTLAATYASGVGAGQITQSAVLNTLKQRQLALFIMGSYQL